MKRNRGAAGAGMMLSVIGVMGLDLVAIRLGFGRTLRILRAAWAMVPQPSLLGLTLSAISLAALAVTMWWHGRRTQARQPSVAPVRSMSSTIGRGIATFGAVLALAAVSGCATLPPRAQPSPTALCSDLTLDHRSLYCANDARHEAARTH